MIAAIYFSPTDTSRKGAEAIAKALGDGEFLSIDVTRFDAEPERTEFGPEDAVVFGAPVYGGRLYRGCRERFRRFRGNGTPCIVTVTYGNRDYDDALLELFDLAREQGFVPAAAAALPSHIKNGYVDRSAALPAILTGLATAGLCAWAASGLDTGLLRRCFGGFLLVVGLRELFRKGSPTAR